MLQAVRQLVILFGIICVVLLCSQPAHALRCGNRLVLEGMHETRVIAICGEPTAVRHVGFVLRPQMITRPADTFGIRSTAHIHTGFHHELAVTEMIFNFGPRKLMRVLRFEGGILKSIRTAGYGYFDESGQTNR